MPDTGHPLYAAFSKARRRLIVIGQLAQSTAQSLTSHLKTLAKNCVVLHECLGGEAFLPCPIDAVISNEDESLQPDFILYLGRTLVSKPFKLWIRKQKAECWMANATGKVEDVTGLLTGIVGCGLLLVGGGLLLKAGNPSLLLISLVVLLSDGDKTSLQERIFGLL